MVEVKTQAMLPATNYLTLSGEITGYLINRAPVAEAVLPSHLVLGPYSPIIQRLYAQSRQVFVHRESSRTAGFKVLEKMRINPLWQNPLFNEGLREIEQEFRQMVTKKDAGERGITVFMDPLTQAIGTTEVILGDYVSVPGGFHSIDETIFSEKLPLIHLHTHPDNVLFSPNDYYPLITRAALYGYGRRLKAVMVLCPSLQVLALATARTMLLSSDEASRLIGDWSLTVEGDAEGKAVASAMEQLMIEHIRRTQEDVGRTAMLTQTITRGTPLSRKERRGLRRKTEKGYTAFQGRERRFEQTLAELENRAAALNNAELLEFARMINVALYMSTNTVDFYKFSA